MKKEDIGSLTIDEKPVTDIVGKNEMFVEAVTGFTLQASDSFVVSAFITPSLSFPDLKVNGFFPIF